VERIEPLEELYKIEGVHALSDEGAVAMILVADADSQEIASPLLSAKL
jgi:hypothetical protein